MFSPASGTEGGLAAPTGFSLTVTDTAGASATTADAALLSIDAGLSLTPVLAPPVQAGAPVVIGTLTPPACRATRCAWAPAA